MCRTLSFNLVWYERMMIHEGKKSLLNTISVNKAPNGPTVGSKSLNWFN